MKRGAGAQMAMLWSNVCFEFQEYRLESL